MIPYKHHSVVLQVILSWELPSHVVLKKIVKKQVCASFRYCPHYKREIFKENLTYSYCLCLIVSIMRIVISLQCLAYNSYISLLFFHNIFFPDIFNNLVPIILLVINNTCIYSKNEIKFDSEATDLKIRK